MGNLTPNVSSFSVSQKPLVKANFWIATRYKHCDLLRQNATLSQQFSASSSQSLRCIIWLASKDRNTYSQIGRLYLFSLFTPYYSSYCPIALNYKV